VPFFGTKTQKKKISSFIHAQKKAVLLIFSFICVLTCIKKTNLEVGLVCYWLIVDIGVWKWITEAFYSANFWMLYSWIVLAPHRKEVSHVLIRPWRLRYLFIGRWKLIYLDLLVCAGSYMSCRIEESEVLLSGLFLSKQVKG
jgi:hypothetical protein